MKTLFIRTFAVVLVSAAGVTPSFAQPATATPSMPEGRGGTSRQAGAVAATAPRGPELRGISVVLVEGDLTTVTSNGNLPAAAAKALADMKDFLPYRGYRVLDTQWTLGSGKIAVRLRGPAGQEYDLELTSSYGDQVSRARMLQLADKGLVSQAQLNQTPAGVSITEFRLREANPLAAPFRAFQGQPPGGLEQGAPGARGRATPLASPIASAGGALIETAFRMDVGETVVVGTSRLQGDKALIVLLTAVAK